MKTLTLLSVFVLLGCKKRSADPEMENVREWIVSNALENPPFLFGVLPPEEWPIRRWTDEAFIVYAPFKYEEEKGWLLFFGRWEHRAAKITRVEFEGLEYPNDRNTLARALDTGVFKKRKKIPASPRRPLFQKPETDSLEQLSSGTPRTTL